MNAAEPLELWDVELSNGEIRTMTLDDLDAAYQAGAIEESTRVRRHGAVSWSTLAIVAGIEDEPARPSAPHSLSPTAISVAPPAPSTAHDVTPPSPVVSLDDVPETAFKKSKTGLVFGMLGAAAVIGVVAFFGSKALKAADAAQEAAKAAAASKETFNPHAAMDLPPAELDKARAKLTEEQRKRLEEADKRRAEEAARKAAERAKNAPAPRQGSRAGKSTDPFVKGGDKYDPLNGNL
jgi:hypothetical protein